MAAYAQFGYSYSSASQLLVGGGQTTTTSTTNASAQSPISGANPPSLSPGGCSVTGAQPGGLSPGALSQTSQNATTSAPPTTASSCCENGRPIMTDPVSGQTVCSCQYDSARLALSGYSRLPSSGVSVYGTPYPSTDQNPYPSIGVDSSAFYSPLSNPYGLKESGPTGDMSAWTSAGLQPTTGYYPYDPTLAAYGYGAGYDLAARRKNATRESTATLKAWLNEHKKNPYPTKGEKIMLAIITKMTLTQVSTWFANARRRLKKENKMTWEPKNKTDDDDDAMVSDDEKDKDDMDGEKGRDMKDSLHHVKTEHEKDDDDDLTDDERKAGEMMGHHPGMGHHHGYHPYYHHGLKQELDIHSKNPTGSDCGVPIPATKPKIWSLADTAACKTPPPLLQQQQQQAHHHAWMTNGGYSQGHHLQHTTHSQGPNGPPVGNTMGMGGMMGGGAMQGNSMGNMGGTPHPNMGHHPQQNMAMSGGVMNSYQQSPYGRYGGFITGTNHQYNTQGNPSHNTNNNNNNNIITNNNNINTNNNVGSMSGAMQHQQMHPTTPTSPSQHHHPSQQPHTQHPQQHPQQHQQHLNPHQLPITGAVAVGHQQNLANNNSSHNTQQTMGFPEALQTDTPPQTPPNMKLPSVAGNLITAAVAAQQQQQQQQIPTTDTCFNNNINKPMNNNNNNNSNNNNNIYHDTSSPDSIGQHQQNGYVGNFRMESDSPMMMNQGQDVAGGFKPFFKSAQQVNNGFVSPV